jgi:hypothetical protein
LIPSRQAGLIVAGLLLALAVGAMIIAALMALGLL